MSCCITVVFSCCTSAGLWQRLSAWWRLCRFTIPTLDCGCGSQSAAYLLTKGYDSTDVDPYLSLTFGIVGFFRHLDLLAYLKMSVFNVMFSVFIFSGVGAGEQRFTLQERYSSVYCRAGLPSQNCPGIPAYPEYYLQVSFNSNKCIPLAWMPLKELLIYAFTFIVRSSAPFKMLTPWYIVNLGFQLKK